MSKMENVQFIPCGHDDKLSIEEIVRLGGAKQLQDIQSGQKLDAVIFHSSKCNVCNDGGGFDDGCWRIGAFGRW